MNLNGVKRKQKEHLQMKFYFCILHSSNILQPGNLASLNNSTVMSVKRLENRAITIFTANNQSMKGYHLLTGKKAK